MKPAAEALAKELPSNKIDTREISKLFSKDYTKHYAVAGELTPKVQNLLNSNASELKISFENLLKNQAKHPEIAFEMYENVINYISTADNHFIDKGKLIFEKTIDDNLYQIAIKTTKSKNENYFLSFHLANHNKKQ